MTAMLASVASLDEALLVLKTGADIIDLKSPADGALGALPIQDVRTIVQRIDGQRPVSATVGDLPMIPKILSEAVTTMATTGVDFIKIGFFPGGNWPASIDALKAPIRNGARLVGVLFADQNPDPALIDDLAAVGFSGVMLDTMDKQNGSLRQVCAPDALRVFVAEAKAMNLLCGLAGSLGQQDIGPLLELAPDYLGFRGALCYKRQRTDRLDPVAVTRVRASIPGEKAFTAQPNFPGPSASFAASP